MSNASNAKCSQNEWRWEITHDQKFDGCPYCYEAKVYRHDDLMWTPMIWWDTEAEATAAVKAWIDGWMHGVHSDIPGEAAGYILGSGLHVRADVFIADADGVTPISQHSGEWFTRFLVRLALAVATLKQDPIGIARWQHALDADGEEAVPDE